MPWTLTDYPVATGQAQPLTPPPGQLVAFDPVPVGQAWRVEGIAVAFPQTPGVALPAPSVAVYDLSLIHISSATMRAPTSWSAPPRNRASPRRPARVSSGSSRACLLYTSRCV